MKVIKLVFVALTLAMVSSLSISAQGDGNDNAGSKTVATMSVTTSVEKLSDEDKEVKDEADKIVNTYVNYLQEYRLGPNDVISVEVFNHCPRYCQKNVIIPPTANISYPLIREGVNVGGKTTFEVQDIITKELDEYIIDPKVSVTLVKAGSAKYSVMGKVAAPAIRIMDRRIGIFEAINESGGVVKDANKKKVILSRMNANGYYERQEINLEAIEKGKAPVIYLKPGDQVFVPGKRFTFEKVMGIIQQASVARILFGSPF